MEPVDGALTSNGRSQRSSKLAAASAWESLISNQPGQTRQPEGQKRGRKPGQIDEAPRKKKGGCASSARAWNLGERASAKAKECKAHWDEYNRYVQFVKPVLEGLRSLSAKDRQQIVSVLDGLEKRGQPQKRQHKPADAVSRQTLNQRLKRMEEDMGGEVAGHLKVWVEKDVSNRLSQLFQMLKSLSASVPLSDLHELESLSAVEATALKFELGLSESKFNTLRNWIPGLLPPLSKIQEKQAELKPEMEPILDGVMISDPLNRLLIPEVVSFLDCDNRPLDQKPPEFVLPDGRGITRFDVKFGADGFTVQNHQTKKLISMEQSGFLVMLPGKRLNSRENTRLVSKQTMGSGAAAAGPADSALEVGKKGHSGEDPEHLKPVFEKFNEMIRSSAQLELSGHLLRFNWILSADYKLQGMAYGLGTGAAASAFFCLWCLTRCSERDTTIQHIYCERSFHSMRVKGTVWECIERECRTEAGKLDGRKVAQVMTLLLGKKVTFEQSKEWAQSMQYDPLVAVDNEHAVIEVLHANINLVRKHYTTAKALAKQLNVDLDSVMKACGLEKDITGWEWEKSKEVRKRSEEWLKKGLGAHPKLPVLLRIWNLLDRLMDVIEAEEPTQDQVAWFGLFVLYWGNLIRSELGPLHPFSVYEHFLICHGYPQLKQFGSLMKYASFYLEASNSLWKATLRDKTSKDGGRVGEGSSADRQALGVLSVRQNPAVSGRFKGSKQGGPRAYQCGKCGETKVPGHTKVCKKRAALATEE